MMEPDEYLRKYKREISYYNKEVDTGSLTQKTPDIWDYVEKLFSNQIEKKTGLPNFYRYVVNHSKDKETIDILGLGSGPCGCELTRLVPLLKEKKARLTKIRLTAVDINENLLNEAKKVAEQKGVEFIPLVSDVNKIQLPENGFDIIMAYASLHHFMELDHIASEINKSLKPDGIFATVDIPTKNGYLMWDDTYELVKSIWEVLPDKYRIAHTGYRKPTLEKEIKNIDYSADSFECVNSEAILPSLRLNLTEVAYVPAFAFTRRFFDMKFGPNYNMNDPLDRSIFEFITHLDRYYIENGILMPETFFGAYVKKTRIPIRKQVTNLLGKFRKTS